MSRGKVIHKYTQIAFITLQTTGPLGRPRKLSKEISTILRTSKPSNVTDHLAWSGRSFLDQVVGFGEVMPLKTILLDFLRGWLQGTVGTSRCSEIEL